MLQQICEYIHNYFVQSAQAGDFEIADGMVSPVSLLDGQRFLIVGSALNDGIYTYHEDGINNDDDTAAAGLREESWSGTICALAVPPSVIALTGEISEWVAKYADIINSPYQSENVIGVYSYTKSGSNSGSAAPGSWQEVFGSRLSRWRKVAF